MIIDNYLHFMLGIYPNTTVRLFSKLVVCTMLRSSIVENFVATNVHSGHVNIPLYSHLLNDIVLYVYSSPLVKM